MEISTIREVMGDAERDDTQPSAGSILKEKMSGLTQGHFAPPSKGSEQTDFEKQKVEEQNSGPQVLDSINDPLRQAKASQASAQQSLHK
eukprot:jgi/Chlat1/4950/Chrsp32S04945